MTAKTTTHVIDNVLLDPFYREMVDKMCSGKNYEDLWQDFMLILLEYPQEKLVDIYNSGTLRYFSIGIIRNQVHSSTSPHHKKYRGSWDIPEGHEEAYTPDLDKQLDEQTKLNIIKELLKEEHWYDRQLFEMYYLDGYSYGELADKTNIPKSSIWHTVTETKKRLIKKLKNNDRNNTRSN